jgi:hypothetical protein
VKKAFIFCFLSLFFVSSHAATFDINAVYEASHLKVKETVCGWEPDLSIGYVMTDNDCYFTKYSLEVPMYGLHFEPKTKNIPEGTKIAYYMSFFDSATPDKDKFKVEMVAESGVKKVEALFHDRTLQGVVVVKDGGTLRITSEKEQSYIAIYIAAVILTLIGIFFIVRRK